MRPAVDSAKRRDRLIAARALDGREKVVPRATAEKLNRSETTP